jgi:hypothetical protein
MLCSGEQTIWAGLILESLDDVVTPTGSVVTWLRSNLGALNLRLQTEFAISGSGYCIVPEMDQNVSGIYTEMYYCAYYNKMANKNLGASGYDWTEIQGDEQGTIRKVSKNEIAKSFRALAKDCRENLDKLTQWYGENTSPIVPTQILYGERFGGASFDLLPPPDCISACNPIW